MKSFLLFSIFALIQPVFGQDKLWYEKSEILSHYKDLESYDTVFQTRVTDNGSNVVININGSDSLRLTHFFRTEEYSEEVLCDSLVIEFLCTKCAGRHFRKLLDDRKRKWMRLNSSSCVAGKWVSKFNPRSKGPNIYTVPVMDIVREKGFVKVVIYTKDLTRNEWKQLKRSGKNVQSATDEYFNPQ